MTLTKPTVGGDKNAWGTILNAALDDLDTRTTTAQPGNELGYAERTSTFTTTSAAYPGVDVTGLSITVVGKGRPVDVEFFCPGASHSVANTIMTYLLCVNGTPLDASGSLANSVSPSTASGPPGLMKRRVILTNGVSYTFTVKTYAAAAGATTLVGASTAPMYLSAVSR